MPGKVKVKIVSGRNLPIMDRSNLTTDAYVEVKLGSIIYKTDVYRKSLHPVWNSEWFRFEMDDLELQDEPLQIRLMDHDTYSSNDAIGKVYLDLNPLLCNSSRGKDTSGKMISGWIPVYDTMHGIRGEVNLIVKVELFSDLNKFRQSSCGVRFFFTQSVPEGYVAHIMQGFVEELVVNDDPEYQWIDKIRTPRASNEARQTLFSKLSGEVQRRVGLKALELGGNAVIGYKQCFDLEGESGIVVRGIGTAAYLTKQYESQLSPTCGESLGMSREFAELQGYRSLSKSGRSFRRRGGPGRPPRLQRRSFRAPNPSDSMSVLHQLHSHHGDCGDKKDSCDDSCLTTHPIPGNSMNPSMMMPSSAGTGSTRQSYFEAFKSRSSFRENSLKRFVKLKTLNSSTHSVPPTIIGSGSGCSCSHDIPRVKPRLIVATSEPCIESSKEEVAANNPSITTAPMSSLKSISLFPNSAFRSRSASRLPQCSPGFLRKTVQLEEFSERQGNICRAKHTSFEEPNRSRSALAGMVHHRTYSETMSPAKSTVYHEGDRNISRSVTELSTNVAVSVDSAQLATGFIGSNLEGGFESAGSNIDSNVEEDSTSDTSMRYIYCTDYPSASKQRPHPEVGFESDTSKEFPKMSSGNEGYSVDNDDLSPVSEREGFLLLKKKRGSRRKDRYSKSSLIKRASDNFAERGIFFGGTERIKEEVVRFFKRKKSSDDNESCSSSTTKTIASSVKKCSKLKSSPYREAKFFFRRRRTTNATSVLPHSTTNSSNPFRSRSSGQLFRSNSDSHSIGQTSLDSVPSVGSEPIFDPELEYDSSHEPPTEPLVHERVTASIVPKLHLPEVDEEEKENDGESLCLDATNIQTPKFQLHEKCSTSTSCDTGGGGNVVHLNQSKIVDIIRELGYSTESPLKLYISSMDALLVYEPDSSSSDKPDASCDRTTTMDDALPACSRSSPAAFTIDHSAVLAAHGSNCSNIDGCSSRHAALSCNSNSCCRCRQLNTSAMPTRSFPVENKMLGSVHHPTGVRASQFSESEVSLPMPGLSSFSTLGTTDSFTTTTTSASGSFSYLRRIIDEELGDDVHRSNVSIMPVHPENCEDNNISTCNSSLESELALQVLVDSPGHNVVSLRHTADPCYDLNYVLDEDNKRNSILLLNRSSSSAITKPTMDNLNYCSDDDILVVTESRTSSRASCCIIEGRVPHLQHLGNEAKTETNSNKDGCGRSSSSSVAVIVDEAVGKSESCVNLPEKMAIPSNRSPIPEELLCDRSTPTLCNLNQFGNTLTSGVSNCSISAVTNTLSSQSQSQQGSTSTPATTITIPTATVIQSNNNYNNSDNFNINTKNDSNNASGGVKAESVAHNTNANITANNSNSTNANSSSVTCGGGTKKLFLSNSEDNSSLVVSQNPSHNNGANLDDTSKSSLSFSSSTPNSQNPQIDLQHNNHHLNGVVHHQNHNNRPHLQHQIPVVDSEPQDWDQSAYIHDKNNIKPPPPRSAGYASNAKVIPGMLPFPAPQPNMTTTIITSGTGTSPMVMGGGPLHRRSSESDLSTPPKLSTTHLRGFSNASGGLKPGITSTIDQYGLMEYPFITISQFPPGFLTHIGGTVTARSVKLLERISNLDEPESRDAWWNEIRMEIRAHCRAFGCTVVVGYEEHTTMCDDVCVLSASGTAAIAATTIGLKNVELLTVSTKQGATNPVIADAPCPGRGVEKDRNVLSKIDNVINTAATNGALKHILVTPSKLRHDSDLDPNCSMLHIPSNPAGLPFPVKMSRCHVCRKGRVPDVLIVTVDIPPGLHVTGKGTLIQAQVFRPKKDCKGETSAKEVSDSLPFLEYELHRRLINKLKVKGMNAIFGLKVQICLGDKLMVALATGTGMYVSALPPPGVPIITAGNLKTDAQKVLQYQKVVQDAYDRNRQHYDLKSVPVPSNGRQSGSSGEESEEDENSDIPTTTKDTYILEVDDAEDIDIISMLIDPQPTSAFLMNNIDYLHGYEEHHVFSQQMFTQVWRCRIPTLSLRQFTAYFERLVRSVCFKLRKMMPCVLSKLSFRVELPEPDEMQISIIGVALGMVDQSKITVSEKSNSIKSGSAVSVAKEDGEFIFPLEEEVPVTSSTCPSFQKDTSSSGGGDSSSRDLHRGTPPPPSGILVPASSQVNNAGVVLVPRPVPPQAQLPCNVSASPHSQCSSQLSSNSNSGPHTVNLGMKSKFTVEITPLPYIPGARIEKYLGNLNFFFIRETTSIRENGGLSGFVHNFVAEVLAIVRAHVAALGGNAMVSYFMTELALLHNPHKNQGQCLINVGGDVVLIVHPSCVPEEVQMCS